MSSTPFCVFYVCLCHLRFLMFSSYLPPYLLHVSYLHLVIPCPPSLLYSSRLPCPVPPHVLYVSLSSASAHVLFRSTPLYMSLYLPVPTRVPRSSTSPILDTSAYALCFSPCPLRILMCSTPPSVLLPPTPLCPLGHECLVCLASDDSCKRADRPWSHVLFFRREFPRFLHRSRKREMERDPTARRRRLQRCAALARPFLHGKGRASVHVDDRFSR